LKRLVLIYLLLRAWTRRISSTAPSHGRSVSAMERRGSSGLSDYAAAAALAAAIALTLLYLYSAFRQSSETPSPPQSQPGGLYLFFDTAGVIATLTADVTEPEFGGTEYDLQMRVQSPADLQEVTYSIVLTGSARAECATPMATCCR
jgi:hypothetical protein